MYVALLFGLETVIKTELIFFISFECKLDIILIFLSMKMKDSGSETPLIAVLL